MEWRNLEKEVVIEIYVLWRCIESRMCIFMDYLRIRCKKFQMIVNLIDLKEYRYLYWIILVSFYLY